VFAVFVVVPVLFSAIGLVAYAAQGVTEVWQINLILTATCGLFIFSLLKGIRLASNLIDAIDRKRARRLSPRDPPTVRRRKAPSRAGSRPSPHPSVNAPSRVTSGPSPLLRRGRGPVAR
jgi:hypothetical protein